ncbi:MAG TPA: tetratricopeptide repeat protein, partial [Candidatus Hydrogenedentes bacterium]|nr:tetratricopeptide repeat protein [Candidatus Hydrogenedentota bacterium]
MTQEDQPEQGRRDQAPSAEDTLDKQLAEPVLKGQKGMGAALVWASALLIVVVGVFAYGNVLNIPFHFEDREALVDNAALHDPGRLLEAMGQRPLAPLTWFTLAVNWWAAPDKPGAFHVVNLLLHLLNGILVYLCCRKLLPKPVHEPVAMLSGMALVLHPLATESIDYAVGRFGPLGACFTLASILLFLHAVRPREPVRPMSLGLSVACCLAAILSHPACFAAPLALLGAHWVRTRGSGMKPHLAVHTGYAAAAAAVAAAYLGFAGIGSAENAPPLAHRLFTFFATFPAYLRMLVAPYDLTIDHNLPMAQAWSDPGVAHGMLVVGLFAAFVTLLLSYRRCAGGVGLAWYGIILAATALTTSSDAALVERRAYLGLALVVMALSGAFTLIGRPRARVACGIGVALVLLAAGLHTYRRNELWRDELFLWGDAAQKAPTAPRPQEILGRYFLTRGDAATDQLTKTRCYGLALDRLESANALRPGNPETLADLALTLKRHGRIDEALSALLNALEADAEHQRALMHMAVILDERARAARDHVMRLEALDYYARAAEGGAVPAQVLSRYADALAETGDYEGAERLLARAVRTEPSQELKNRLAGLRAVIERLTTMEEQAEEILEKDPDSLAGLFTRARALATRNRLNEAIRMLESVVERDPNARQPWLLLGHIMAREDRAEQFVRKWGTPFKDSEASWTELARLCSTSGLPEAGRVYADAAEAAAEAQAEAAK